jgi:hypothetical protein
MPVASYRRRNSNGCNGAGVLSRPVAYSFIEDLTDNELGIELESGLAWDAGRGIFDFSSL